MEELNSPLSLRSLFPAPALAANIKYLRIASRLTYHKGLPIMLIKRVYSLGRICILGQWFFTFWVLGVTAQSLRLSNGLPSIVPMLGYAVSSVSSEFLQTGDMEDTST
jgi:hypothetical protein